MEGFIVLASFVSELAGGQTDHPPLILNVTKNTLVHNKVLHKLIHLRAFRFLYFRSCMLTTVLLNEASSTTMHCLLED